MAIHASVIMDVIFMVIGIAIGATLFVSVWSSILRPKIYAMLNDSNFTNTWGTGMRDAVVLFLDIIVLLVGLTFLGVLATVFLKKITQIAGK